MLFKEAILSCFLENTDMSQELTKIDGEVFTVRVGEWQVRLGNEILLTTWNSKGAAEAGLEVELRRRKMIRLNL